jgi:hypothetical protein
MLTAPLQHFGLVLMTATMDAIPGVTMTVTEPFPAVTLWEQFDAACEEAEAARARAVKLATAERDRIVTYIAVGNLRAPDRIRSAALARYDQQVQAAQSECEAACARAQRELMAALDQARHGDLA